MAVDADSRRSFWTLNKAMVLVLAGTFLGLFLDLRYEHVDKVRHHWTAWIPIVYSGIMFILCLIGLKIWESKGRELLFYAFAASLIVGLLGFYFHNGAHMLDNVVKTLAAWTTFEHHPDSPPTLAPLSFCGLGVIGMLVSGRWFDRK
jgi:hypothetical protein